MNVDTIAIRMASEAIPFNAIARSLGINRDDLRRGLSEAIRNGDLAEMPAQDWRSARRDGRLDEGKPADEARGHQSPEQAKGEGSRLPLEWGLTDMQTQVMTALASRGGTARMADLVVDVYGKDNLKTRRRIRVHMSAIRDRLLKRGLAIGSVGSVSDRDYSYRISGDLAARLAAVGYVMPEGT